MALRNCTSKITIRHTRDARHRLENAHMVLGIANNLSDQLEEIFNHWSKVHIRNTEVRKLIESAMLPTGGSLSLPNTNKVGETSTYLRNASKRFFNFTMMFSDSGTICHPGTLFGAYNGIMGYFSSMYVPTRRRRTRWIACSIRIWLSSVQRKPSDCVKDLPQTEPCSRRWMISEGQCLITALIHMIKFASRNIVYVDKYIIFINEIVLSVKKHLPWFMHWYCCCCFLPKNGDSGFC